MGATRGEPRKKKNGINADSKHIEDAKTVEEKKTKTSTPKAETKKPETKKETPPADNTPSDNNISNNEFNDANDTGLKTPDVGTSSSFNFQSPEDPEHSRVNIPVKEDNKHEKMTLKNEDSFSMDTSGNNTGNQNNPNPPTGGGNNNPPPPPPPPAGNEYGFDNVVDDMPPGGADTFDEYNPEGGEQPPGGAGGMQLPPDFVKWAAAKKAKWIVDMREIVLGGWMARSAQISDTYLRHQGMKYEVPKTILADILKDAEEYNQAVQNSVSLPKVQRKVLEYLYTAVLEEHNTISEKMSPTTMLIITEIGFFIQQLSNMQEIKKMGVDIVNNHRELFEAHYARMHPNQNINDGKEGGDK